MRLSMDGIAAFAEFGLHRLRDRFRLLQLFDGIGLLRFRFRIPVLLRWSAYRSSQH